MPALTGIPQNTPDKMFANARANTSYLGSISVSEHSFSLKFNVNRLSR